MSDKLEAFRAKVEADTKQRYAEQGFTYEIHAPQMVVTVKPGKKYTKVDVGTSGKYMVDDTGTIYGIKAYGVIHRGHCYGTLDTINEYFWGGFVAVKVKS